MYAVSTAKVERPDLSLTILGSLAADVVAEAIVRGVRAATSIPDWPAASGMRAG
jgi:L-aminopeptidase/D-esterase-like protein